MTVSCNRCPHGLTNKDGELKDHYKGSDYNDLPCKDCPAGKVQYEAKTKETELHPGYETPTKKTWPMKLEEPGIRTEGSYAIMRLAAFFWSNPRAGLVLAGKLNGKSLEEIGQRLDALLGYGGVSKQMAEKYEKEIVEEWPEMARVICPHKEK